MVIYQVQIYHVPSGLTLLHEWGVTPRIDHKIGYVFYEKNSYLVLYVRDRKKTCEIHDYFVKWKSSPEEEEGEVLEEFDVENEVHMKYVEEAMNFLHKYFKKPEGFSHEQVIRSTY